MALTLALALTLTLTLTLTLARRGLLVCLFAVGQSLGMNVFFLTDFALPPPTVSWAWRVLVMLGATPAIATLPLALTLTLPLTLTRCDPRHRRHLPRIRLQG